MDAMVSVPPPRLLTAHGWIGQSILRSLISFQYTFHFEYFHQWEQTNAAFVIVISTTIKSFVFFVCSRWISCRKAGTLSIYIWKNCLANTASPKSVCFIPIHLHLFYNSLPFILNVFSKSIIILFISVYPLLF